MLVYQRVFRDDVSTVSQEKYALEPWQKPGEESSVHPSGPTWGTRRRETSNQPTGCVETRFFNGMGISNGEFSGISGVSWDLC
jgi:hypothetical protein